MTDIVYHGSINKKKERGEWGRDGGEMIVEKEEPETQLCGLVSGLFSPHTYIVQGVYIVFGCLVDWVGPCEAMSVP